MRLTNGGMKDASGLGRFSGHPSREVGDLFIWKPEHHSKLILIIIVHILWLTSAIRLFTFPVINHSHVTSSAIKSTGLEAQEGYTRMSWRKGRLFVKISL